MFGADVGVISGMTPSPMVGVMTDARVGYRFDLGRVWVSPEAITGYTGFFASNFHIGRAGVGARLGFPLAEGRFEPSLFSHAGGWFHPGGGGPGFDAGIALDGRVGPRVTVGVHGACDLVGAEFINAMMAYSFLTAGAHVGFVL
jgi:hypothetical protein